MSTQLSPARLAETAAARAELAAIERALLRKDEYERWTDGIPHSLRPLLEPARYKGAYGGRGGAKSHFFGEALVQRCVSKPTRAVCIREVQRSLEQSVKRLLEDKIRRFGFQSSFRTTTTQIQAPGGGVIIFQGMQDHTAESIKSLEGFDIAWVEEAHMLSEHSLTLLRPTIRKEGSELWFSWNPRFATDPVDRFFRAGPPPPDSICVETSYADNPYLPEALQREIEWDRQRDPDRFQHIWRGGYQRHSEARVFRNWRVEEFVAPRHTAFLLGGDWGFANDPTALVRCWFRDARTLCIDFEAYEVGCEIEDTPALFDSLLCGPLCGNPRSSCQRPEHGAARGWPLIADSSRPETISFMRRHGYPCIEPSQKGANSVEEGVTFLRSYDIVVHPRCVHTIDELTFYSYRVDAVTNQILPQLVDKNNHIIDSLRYALESSRRRRQKAGLLF